MSIDEAIILLNRHRLRGIACWRYVETPEGGYVRGYYGMGKFTAEWAITEAEKIQSQKEVA